MEHANPVQFVAELTPEVVDGCWWVLFEEEPVDEIGLRNLYRFEAGKVRRLGDNEVVAEYRVADGILTTTQGAEVVEYRSPAGLGEHPCDHLSGSVRAGDAIAGGYFTMIREREA